MAIVDSWHSVLQDVHHVCTECYTGNNIEEEHFRLGTGGKPRCSECAGLIANGQWAASQAGPTSSPSSKFHTR